MCQPLFEPRRAIAHVPRHIPGFHNDRLKAPTAAQDPMIFLFMMEMNLTCLHPRREVLAPCRASTVGAASRCPTISFLLFCRTPSFKALAY